MQPYYLCMWGASITQTMQGLAKHSKSSTLPKSCAGSCITVVLSELQLLLGRRQTVFWQDPKESQNNPPCMPVIPLEGNSRLTVTDHVESRISARQSVCIDLKLPYIFLITIGTQLPQTLWEAPASVPCSMSHGKDLYSCLTDLDLDIPCNIACFACVPISKFDNLKNYFYTYTDRCS